MKKHLTKIYNIFKQIEALNGVSGWDQDKSFYYFYESNDLVRCWELLYGLFSENKQIDIKKFGVDLNISQLRKLAFGRSCVYEFDSIGVTPVLVATFERNGKHQISGKVEIEETSISEEKTVEFIDGNKIDEDFEESDANSKLKIFLLSNVGNMSVDKDELLNVTNEQTIQSMVDMGVLEESIGNSYVIVDMESFDLLDTSAPITFEELKLKINSDSNYASKLENLLRSKGVNLAFIELFIIKIDQLTTNEINDIGFIEDRIDVHMEEEVDEQYLIKTSANEKLKTLFSPKSPQLIAWESAFLKNETPSLALQWVDSLGGDIEWLKRLKSLLDEKGVDFNFFKSYLIDVDKLTSEEIKNLDYVEDRLDTHLEESDDAGFELDSVDEQEELASNISLCFSFFDYIEDFSSLKEQEFLSIINKLKSVEGLTIFTDNDGTLSWRTDLGISLIVAEQLNELLHSSQNQEIFDNSNILVEQEPSELYDKFQNLNETEEAIINCIAFHLGNHLIDQIDYNSLSAEDIASVFDGLKEIDGLQIDGYNNIKWDSNISLRIEITDVFYKLSNLGNIPIFRIYGIIPESLTNLEEVSLFLDYLYDDCGLLGIFNPDDSFDSYNTENNEKLLFSNEQQEKYGKYIDDMFEMDSDGESLFVQAGYDDIYDYCMNYRNDNYNTKQKFDFTAYIQDGKLSVGIKSDDEFEGSEDLGDNSYTRYLMFEPGNDAYFPQFNELNINWNAGLNSWDVQTNSGFSKSDIGLSWEDTTEQQVIDYLTTDILGDYQFDKKSDNYMGFINIDPEDISDMKKYDVILWIINNQTSAEKIANNLGLTIETANSGEFIVSELEIDLNRKCQQYLSASRNPEANVFFLQNSQISDTLINFDINKLGDDDIFSILRCEVAGPKVIFYEFMVINNDGVSENYQSETEYYIDENNNFEVIRGHFDDRCELAPGVDGIGGHDLFNMKGKIISLMSSNPVSTKPLVTKPTIVNLEMDLVSKIKWLKQFIFDWNEITDNDLLTENPDVTPKWVEGKMKVMSEKLDNFCDVNGLISMSADDLLIELENKNNWFGPLELNNVNYRVKLIINEDDENKYYLEFYKNQGFTKVSQLIGDGEIWMDDDGNIDSIEWTLPEYESIIDPDGTLYENEELFEMIQNINLRPY